MHDRLRRGDQAEHFRGEEYSCYANRQGDDSASNEGLEGDQPSSFRIFFPNATRDHRGDSHAESKADSEHQDDQRRSCAYGVQRFRPKLAHEISVHELEYRLHEHFEDHGNGQQADGARHATLRVVLVSASENKADLSPQ